MLDETYDEVAPRLKEFRLDWGTHKLSVSPGELTAWLKQTTKWPVVQRGDEITIHPCEVQMDWASYELTPAVKVLTQPWGEQVLVKSPDSAPTVDITKDGKPVPCRPWELLKLEVVEKTRTACIIKATWQGGCDCWGNPPYAEPAWQLLERLVGQFEAVTAGVPRGLKGGTMSRVVEAWKLMTQKGIRKTEACRRVGIDTRTYDRHADEVTHYLADLEAAAQGTSWD